LTFDGKIDGEIQTDGTLQLGNNAVINGNISAQTVVVRGKIKGNVVANDKIEIKANTELFGDIRASKLAMEEGVTFVGRTEINPKKAPHHHSHCAHGRAEDIRTSSRPVKGLNSCDLDPIKIRDEAR
jgi:cytoskeletal protein CcmA (bactofilin family)